MVSQQEEPKTTQLRDYYAALEALEEREQTLLAEEHAERPGPLIKRFAHSAETAAKRQVDPSEHFHDGTRKELPVPPIPLAELKSTFDFASHLAGRPHSVAEAPELGFAYVDRELFPGRRKAKEGRMVSRTLDLLLRSTDHGLPVIGELKIRGDSLTYFAMVQALMHAAELVAPLQQQRLVEHYGRAFSLRDEGPFADVYLIAFEPPKTGRYRERSFHASRQIAERLMGSPKIARHLRRIAYLTAESNAAGLSFSVRFSFPD